MPGETELAGDLQPFVARGDAGKSDAAVHHVLVDAVEAPEEIEMPPGAAEFAVGDRLQTDLFLFFDDALDLAVFDRFQVGGGNFAFRPFVARRFQRRRPQQAADVIGAEWRFGALRHCCFAPFTFFLIPPLSGEGGCER